MTDAIDQRDYEHVYPPYNVTLPPTRAGAAPEPLRKFDMRTEPERLSMWCASLEERHENLALRVAYLEMQVHRLLNRGEVDTGA